MLLKYLMHRFFPVADTEFDTILNDGIGRKTYRIVESYIPGKPNNVYSKLCLTICSLVIISTILLMYGLSEYEPGKRGTSKFLWTFLSFYKLNLRTELFPCVKSIEKNHMPK